ncbi:hypothetical protein [Actinomadura fibrosa]|uniref:Tetratricopeptide repeat protein n=1 Tax=Actinomadura fibrosa TaxID=111802 RepID=A0ABW2XCH5_9ACTN|nr:hypothetical protein [Actinomadura fibrosa]
MRFSDRPLSDAEARLLARNETALHRAETTGELCRLAAAHAAGAAELGPGNPVVLLVECGLEELRGRTRTVRESVRAWEDLLGRAGKVLAEDHPVLMSIRTQYIRHRRMRGTRADLDHGVRAYRTEWQWRCERFGEDHQRTRAIRANLALALRDRNGEGDLPDALRLLEDELAHRLGRYGTGHPFTWVGQLVLAQTILRAVEEDAAGTRAGLPAPDAERALRLSQTVVDVRNSRFGRADGATLRAHLVHAHALLTSGRAADATGELHHIRATARRSGVPLEPGWAEVLLARAQSVTGDPQASRTAREACRRRLDHFPVDSVQVAEALTLLDRLGALRP